MGNCTGYCMSEDPNGKRKITVEQKDGEGQYAQNNVAYIDEQILLMRSNETMHERQQDNQARTGLLCEHGLLGQILGTYRKLYH